MASQFPIIAQFVPLNTEENVNIMSLHPLRLVTVGRSRIPNVVTTGFVLDDTVAFVSRRHAIIQYVPEEECVYFTNISGTNGSFYGPNLENKIEENETVKISDGSRVSFGGRYRQARGGPNDEVQSGRVVMNPFVFVLNVPEYPARAEWKYEVPDGFCCDICQSALHKPVLLRCGHVFCKGCITRWSRDKTDCHCPSCRVGINSDEVSVVNEALSKIIEVASQEISAPVFGLEFKSEKEGFCGTCNVLCNDPFYLPISKKFCCHECCKDIPEERFRCTTVARMFDEMRAKEGREENIPAYYKIAVPADIDECATQRIKRNKRKVTFEIDKPSDNSVARNTRSQKTLS